MTAEFLKIPDKFIVMEGEKAQYGRFFSAHIKDASDEGILKNGVYTGKNDGKNFDADIKMPGILDVKRAEAEVVKNKKLIACGNAIGVKLYTDGVLVADLTEFEQKDGGNVSPARGAGLKPGDFITYAGGEKITGVKELKAQTEKHKNKKMKIKFLRNSKERETEIEPKQEKNSGVWRLGFWAKDSTAGIGTLTYFDPETNERYTPYVIEPSLGADRMTLALLCDAYDEEVVGQDKNGKDDVRTVLHLHPALAPFKAAVLPLSKKLSPKAEEIYHELQKDFMVDFDDSGSIGKRYRREDEIGTPYCITFDFDTVGDEANGIAADHCVTIRERDSMEQVRIPIDQVKDFLREKCAF